MASAERSKRRRSDSAPATIYPSRWGGDTIAQSLGIAWVCPRSSEGRLEEASGGGRIELGDGRMSGADRSEKARLRSAVRRGSSVTKGH